MLNLRLFLRSLADLALPRVCPICGKNLLLSENVVCTCCLADLPLTHFWEYSHNVMADEFNARLCNVSDCHRYCFAAALIFFEKESPYKVIPRKLKYERHFEQGLFFASMLGEKLSSSEQFRDVDTLVPVPLHWQRRWKRGYNQALIIAEGMCTAFTGARVVPDLLIRSRKTATQTGLEGKEKEENVHGAFTCSAKADRIHPVHILIVDDVFTSGSTTAECWDALHKKYGDGTRISVATLAYVKKD